MVVRQNIDPDQGSFFDVEITGNGVTDPNAYRPVAQLTANPEGAYSSVEPEVFTPPSIVDEGVMQRIREEGKTRNRQKGQLGKHSALGEDGQYGPLRAGQFLPGFGAVTHSNIAAAEAHAASLRKG